MFRRYIVYIQFADWSRVYAYVDPQDGCPTFFHADRHPHYAHLWTPQDKERYEGREEHRQGLTAVWQEVECRIKR